MKVALILNGKTPQSTQYKPLPVSVPDLLARYPKMGKILKNTAPEHRGVPTTHSR